ncbi:MAG TPA: CRISPR-associated endonuclease Cas2 [Bacteroidales bacterium]|jgi:CRISPR-associated protein Cas2|nr:CRISPR-associated endonuclease Cas2 [Bacteroidales bacterium]HOH94236.1 CRISPR-associated endonuclease Cas2 [Bacteroidales bacterium]HPZ75200.1 CRISPR-associated endonuclease Cas2 [Candidatus Pacearchaeota archaeon]
MQQQRLNAYRSMWLIVLYDLPTETAQQRKKAAKFHKDLQSLGFSMFQFSVYVRNSASGEYLAVNKNQVKSLMPDEGAVAIIELTDRQFENIEIFIGQKREQPPDRPIQLELF